jgi:uncharacterized protein (UPF0276 family)
VLRVNVLQEIAVAHPNPTNSFSFQQTGLGLRQVLLSSLQQSIHEQTHPCAILELAPENWCGMGGIKKKYLNEFSENFQFYCHGLSLSLGGQAPLNMSFLEEVKQFLNQYNVVCYSEHLSFSSDNQGMLYDLLPLPFTEETVKYVAKRIALVQDFLQRSIAIENISYYITLNHELDELTFIKAVLSEAKCDLLLDVNNVYVNSQNHYYDAKAFIHAIPNDKVKYLHIAGHQQQSFKDFGLEQDETILIDTHHYPVPTVVWDLLAYTYHCHGVIPTVLECDNDIPTWSKVCDELTCIQDIIETSHVDTTAVI